MGTYVDRAMEGLKEEWEKRQSFVVALFLPLGEIEDLLKGGLAEADVVGECTGLVDFKGALAGVGMIRGDPVRSSVSSELDSMVSRCNADGKGLSGDLTARHGNSPHSTEK